MSAEKNLPPSPIPELPLSTKGEGQGAAILLRRMTLDDVDAVHEIDRLSFSLPWPRRSFIFELQESLVSRCWVAEVDGVLAGMVVTWLIMEEAHVATIAVHPERRGLGLGKRLLALALAEARQIGCEYVALEVRISNASAIQLYQAFGFDETGRRPHYYHDTQEDALLMEARLDVTELPQAFADYSGLPEVQAALAQPPAISLPGQNGANV